MITIPGIVVGPGGKALGGIQDESTRPPAQIDVFIDYMCPYCRRFERDNGDAIREMVDRDIATLVMHPISILDRLSLGTMYSTRAAAAAYAVAANDPGEFGDFSTALFTHQPKEGGSGLSEAELENLGHNIGIEPAVTRTFADKQFLSTVALNTQTALDLGLRGTPTVLLTGRHEPTRQWDGSQPIAEALGSLAAR
ncbi:MAG: thioredoxin domain-containing protein [Bifidobacteriaceae bacterium]|jgi:protein-disulfide isomerase|nr:thioredoxin domain-containing protein [Bifidobacteriaceae bacterium]